MIRYLCSAIAATTVAILCLASPAGAWSFSDGAVAIHSDSSYGGDMPAVQVDSAGNIYACGHFRTGNGTGDVDPNPAVAVNVTVTGTNSSAVCASTSTGGQTAASVATTRVTAGMRDKPPGCVDIARFFGMHNWRESADYIGLPDRR